MEVLDANAAVEGAGDGFVVLFSAIAVETEVRGEGGPPGGTEERVEIRRRRGAGGGWVRKRDPLEKGLAGARVPRGDVRRRATRRPGSRGGRGGVVLFRRQRGLRRLWCRGVCEPSPACRGGGWRWFLSWRGSCGYTHAHILMLSDDGSLTGGWERPGVSRSGPSDNLEARPDSQGPAASPRGFIESASPPSSTASGGQAPITGRSVGLPTGGPVSR